MFKVGQKVECIDTWYQDSGLTKNKEYVVMAVGRILKSEDEGIWIIDDMNDMDWYPNKCFKEVE